MRRALFIVLVLLTPASSAAAARSQRTAKNAQDASHFPAMTIAVAKPSAGAAAPPRKSSARELPPIGARRYVVDPKDATGPVRIEALGRGQSGVFMKDPRQPGELVAPPPAPPRPPPPPPRPPGLRPAQLRFPRLPIAGKMTRPRVEFARDLLPLRRADEPLASDFLPKVYQPIEDNEF